MNLLRKLIYILLLLPFASKAQQMYHFSLFTDNNFVLNPAVTGIKDETEISASFRKQWLKVHKSPLTAFAGFNTSYPKKNLGLGAYIYDDETGPTAVTGFGVNVAYHIHFKEHWSSLKKHYLDKTLSFGLSPSVVYYRLNTKNALLDNPDDPILHSGVGQKIFPDASFGIFYNSDVIFVGASIPQLLNLNTAYKVNGNISNIKKLQHYYFQIGTHIYFHRDEWSVVPNLWLKYVIGGYPQGMLNVRVNWIDKGYIGMSYRSLKGVTFEAGAIIKKKYKIGYAYDLDMSKYSLDLGMTHELFLSYKFVSIWQD
jgi:type IX secretion system PorP/SprF family membrane protein